MTRGDEPVRAAATEVLQRGQPVGEAQVLQRISAKDRSCPR
jgi:hypothetical protein